MKKTQLTKNILLSTVAIVMLSTTANAANTNGLSLKVGAGNSEIGTQSQSGTEIGLEVSFTKNKSKSYDIFIELAGTLGSEGTTTNYGIGARYEVIPKLYVGGSLGFSGYSSSNSNSTSSLVGFTTSISAKYSFTPNHGVLAEYRTGTMDDESGLVEYDYTGTAINYIYSF